MAPPEATPADVSIRELEQTWGCSRNGLKARAKRLGVELKRVSSTLTVWPGEWLDLGEQLNDHLEAGQPMELFPGLKPVAPAVVPSRQDNATSSLAINETAGLAAVVTAVRDATTPPADPLRTARLLAEAADLGVTLSGAELADVLRLSPKSIARWGDGHSPRPGIVLNRQEVSGRVWWIVRRAEGGGSARLMPSRQQDGGGRSVGFATAMDVTATVLEPGPSLFPLC